MISTKERNRQKVAIKGASVISTDDSGPFRYAYVNGLGKAQKTQAFSPYGLCTNPPDESMSISLLIQGVSANIVSLIDDPKRRKKNLAKGEVSLYNYETESTIYLKADGSILLETTTGEKVEIIKGGTINIDDAAGTSITITGGAVNINAATSATITAPTTTINSTTAINMTAPTMTFTGATALNFTAPAINFTGAVTTAGVMAATDFSTAQVPSFNVHPHEAGTVLLDSVGGNVTGTTGAPPSP